MFYLEVIVEEIKKLLTEIKYPESISSKDDVIRFIKLIVDILRGDRNTDSYQGLVSTINKNTKAFITLFKKIHEFLIYNKNNRYLDELNFFLFQFKDDFYTKENYQFLRFLVKESLQMGLNIKKYDSVMRQYVELISFFYPNRKPFYGDIIDLKEILIDLDNLWERYHDNSQWGSYYYYIPGKEFFFDNAGAIGNLAYLRWSVRDLLGIFKVFKEQLDFVMEEVNTLIVMNSPLIGVYFFTEFYENIKYYGSTFDTVEKSYFLKEIPKLTQLLT